MKVKKVLLVGEQELDPSIYTYITSFKDSFLLLGFEVFMFNTKKSYLPFTNTMVYRLPNVLKKISNYICNRKLLNYSKKISPDLIFFLKAENIFLTTIQQVKNKKNVVVNFFPDNPLVVWNDSSNIEVLKSIREYDYFLSWSKILIPAYISMGAKSVYYFPFAYDQNIYPEYADLNLNDSNKCDVCFVGTWEPYREIWLESLIRINPEINLLIWGNQWSDKLPIHSKLRNYLKGDAIYFNEMLSVFKMSKIVLNFIRVQNYSSHNMRTIETLASNAFLLTQRTEEQAAELFIEGEHIACFADINELNYKIEYYLKNEEERMLILEKGKQKVKEYKLVDQLARLIDYIEKQEFE